ncbi:SRPBCC family protein [Paraburkholderia diazotrophica]|uniref:Polyketide cyclase / dehydrase and lipid transport n=1 Tax=Paraburkholderia diazotrophica TaxID=667676 RepID=A0A1H7DNN6_9BURK|nr:SRPBCC family protein [Paraburkholderia diazotrophica]SEK01252.1 Polyketide cyclase / dehydrase and lipid transport [Paraburkholderia diazotrophica]
MNTLVRAIATVACMAAALGLLFVPLPRAFDLSTRIVTVELIARPSTAVFDYVTTPANWPAWHPSSLSVTGATDHSLAVGEQTTEEFRVAGRRGRVVWTVVERNRPDKWTIDGTIDGRPAGTVSYTLTPDVNGTNGTRFERTFVYRSPTLWFVLLNAALLRAKIQAESDEAVKRLKNALEQQARQRE